METDEAAAAAATAPVVDTYLPEVTANDFDSTTFFYVPPESWKLLKTDEVCDFAPAFFIARLSA